MSHFNVSFIVWAKSQDSVCKPQFLKRKENRSGSNRGPSAYQPSQARLKEGHCLTALLMPGAQQDPGSMGKLSLGPGWSACLTYFPQLCSTKEGWNSRGGERFVVVVVVLGIDLRLLLFACPVRVIEGESRFKSSLLLCPLF